MPFKPSPFSPCDLAEPDPSKLRRAIFARLVDNPEVSTIHIDIRVDGSVVTLGGRVSSNGQREAAAIGARKVSGVSRLINEIRVAVPTLATGHAAKAIDPCRSIGLSEPPHPGSSEGRPAAEPGGSLAP